MDHDLIGGGTLFIKT